MLTKINWPNPGRYILAVSGGADSMALLDIFAAAASQRGYDLVVAHYDHGLRPSSVADRELVERAAASYRLPVFVEAGQLGRASEAAARAARYRFLDRVRLEQKATAIITAHHQDDLVETSLLNLARGTGRHGLAPMSNPAVLRPLLAVTRTELRQYAIRRQLSWHEDPTNADLSNPRNFLRHQLLPVANPAWRENYLSIITNLAVLNSDIDQKITQLIGDSYKQTGKVHLPRPLVRDSSLAELAELILAAARCLRPGIELDARLLQEVTLFAKTGRLGTHRPLRQDLMITIERHAISLSPRQN